MLCYADAVALLGGDTDMMKLVDRALGGAWFVGTAGGAEFIPGLAEARGEVIRAGHELIGRVRDRRRGFSRYDRTQRLLAAHAVLVLVAFVEALAEVALPFDPKRLELTGGDQLRVAGLRECQQDLVQALLDLRVAVPGAELAPSAQRAALTESYRDAAGRWLTLLRGLAVWDELDDRARARTVEALQNALPARAVDRYD